MLTQSFRCLLLIGVCVLTHASMASGQVIHDSNYSLNLYFSMTDAGPGGSAVNDLAIGNGGAYGFDLYAGDFGTFTGGDGNGRVWRITDSNNDGIGEGSVFSTAVGTPYRSPISLTFGVGGGSPFGDSLYLLDYSGSTSQRYVYQVNGSGTPTQYTTSSVFNPDGLEAHPDGQRLLVNDASTFTVFGGGDDANILQVSGTGAITNWANGSNNANGLWDINGESVFSPDGWYTLIHHSIGPSNLRELIQFKDLNMDGDANDAGESRVLLGLGSPIAQSAGLGFDGQGNLLFSSGNDLYRYTDLNNDGNYWDFVNGTFDAGERFLLAEDLGDWFIKSIAFRGSTIYVGAVNTNGTSDIYRIISPVPEPSSAIALAAVGLCIATCRRRRNARNS